MSTLHEMANGIRESEKAIDAKAIAKGLYDTASVCSNEQQAIATRLRLAADKLIQQADAIDKGVATLTGVRNMAAIEAREGSVSWSRTIMMIDACIKVMT